MLKQVSFATTLMLALVSQRQRDQTVRKCGNEHSDKSRVVLLEATSEATQRNYRHWDSVVDIIQ